MMHEHPVQKIVEPTIDGMGYEIVRVAMSGGQRQTLQIMIERQDRQNLTVDDCAAVSRAVSEILDEKDPIDGEYSLEVSSPGLDRPLTKPEHFERFAGYETKIETTAEVAGRKRFKGMLRGIDSDEIIHFDMDGNSYAIPFDVVGKAKLVLTDELLNRYMEENPEIEL